MSVDSVLVERVRDQLADKRIVEKRMFGGWGVMWRGNLLVGVMGEDLIARVGTEAMADALARPGARPFDFTGRPMRGWVFVGADALEDDGDLRAWLERCEAFVATLPEK